MTSRAMSMRLYAMPLGLLATGLVLMGLYHAAPRYRDPALVEPMRHYVDAAFFEAQRANVTVESERWHMGAGLATLGAVLVVGGAILRVRRVADLRALTTPRARWPLFLLNTGTILGGGASFYFFASRWRDPSFYASWWGGHSVTQIVHAAIVVTVLLLPFSPILLALCVWRARLPASLWLRPRHLWGWLVTAVTVPWAAWMLLLMWAPVVVEGHAVFIPLWACLLYLLACGRAAAASRPNRHEGSSPRRCWRSRPSPAI